MLNPLAAATVGLPPLVPPTALRYAPCKRIEVESLCSVEQSIPKAEIASRTRRFSMLARSASNNEARARPTRSSFNIVTSSAPSPRRAGS